MQTLIATGNALLDAHPQAALDRTFRAALYTEIEANASTARQIRARLAFASAQKVYPIVEDYTDYWETRLQDALEMLRALADRSEKPEGLDELTDFFYHACGNWAWLSEDEEGYPYVPGKYTLSADYGAMTLYKALGEAAGGRKKPFDSLKNFQSFPIPSVPKSLDPDAYKAFFTQLVESNPQLVSGLQFDEAKIADLAGAGDAAGVAACAFAVDDQTERLDPAQFKAFWVWWLNVAVPDACSVL
jgi:hypothetical protein